MSDYSRSGWLPNGKPITIHVRRLPTCTCGEPLYSIDGGPPEHTIPAGASVDDWRAWAARCPILRAENERARIAIQP